MSKTYAKTMPTQHSRTVKIIVQTKFSPPFLQHNTIISVIRQKVNAFARITFLQIYYILSVFITKITLTTEKRLLAEKPLSYRYFTSSSGSANHSRTA